MSSRSINIVKYDHLHYFYRFRRLFGWDLILGQPKSADASPSCLPNVFLHYSSGYVSKFGCVITIFVLIKICGLGVAIYFALYVCVTIKSFCSIFFELNAQVESVAIVNVGALISNDDDFFWELGALPYKNTVKFPTNIGEWLLVLTVSTTRCGNVQIDNLG